MTNYSLIEYKLRRYFYLGHEHPMYISSSLKPTSYKNHKADFLGIKIIGKIVKKNKPEEINSIVPVILKIKNEGELHDDKHLIFALAVCAGFQLKQCFKMVDDALAAILTVCSDGLKLLMFIKNYETAVKLLVNAGYLSIYSTFSNKFQKALSNWYLSKDPIFLAEQICRYKFYDNWSHKKVFKLIHFHSDKQSFKMIILYVIYGMERIEEEFGTIVKNMQLNNYLEILEKKHLKSLYNYFKSVNNLNTKDEIALRNAIETNCWGKQFEVVPHHMASSAYVQTALIKNMSMKNVLDQTFQFAKRNVFNNPSSDNGVREYILSFTNSIHLKESRIHPIESFLEYVKYSRTCLSIMKFQERDSKKLNNLKIKLPTNKLNSIFEISNTGRDGLNSEVVETTSNKNKNKSKIKMINTKPLPKLDKEILDFLSVDLVIKTLDNLKPSGHRIMITYDCRPYLKMKNCGGTPLLKIHEAIALIILSLIYPEPLSNKPSIYRLDGSMDKRNKLIKIDYEEPMTFDSLDSVLFEMTDNVIFNDQIIPNVNPLSTILWAIKKKEKYDLFVILGSHKMSLQKLEKAKKRYQEFVKKPVKIIVCCLDGMHLYQSFVYHQNMLFIAGFDKNVGKIINFFIHNKF